MKLLQFLEKYYYIFLIVLIIFQAVQAVNSFSSISGIFNNEPIYNDDFPVVYYQCSSARKFFLKSRALWGYDPYFMAGYPLTFIWNSNVVIQLPSSLFSGLSLALILKLFHMLSIILVPFVLYLTCRNFEFSKFESLIGATIGITYFRLDIPTIFSFLGMTSAYLVSYLSIYVLSLFYNYYKFQKLKSCLLLCIFTPLILLVHKTSVVILLIPLFLMFLIFVKKLNIRAYFFNLFLLILSLLVNYFWLHPLVHFIQYKTVITNAPFWLISDPLRIFKDYFTFGKVLSFHSFEKMYGTTLIEASLLVSGIYGLLIWKRFKEYEKFVLFSSVLIFMFLLTYYGSFWKITAILNPSRYMIPLNLYLLVPSVHGISNILTMFQRRYSKVAFRIFITVLFFLIVGVNFTRSFYSFSPHLLLNTSIDKNAERLIGWIKENTAYDGRILIEDSGTWDREGGGHQYYGSHLPALLPIFTSREFIGGPYPDLYLKHHFASFQDGILFGRDIENYSLEKIKAYFDLYNLKWVICWSKRSQNVFDQYPEYLIKKVKIDKFTIYSLNREPSFFIKGKGRISADYNRIILKDVIPEDNEVIIKYHWMETLRTNPTLKIERVYSLDDPIGFIKVIDPPRDFEIYNSYKF